MGSLSQLQLSQRKEKDILFHQKLDLDRELCPVTSIKEYLKRTKGIRKNSNLFLSYIKPFGQLNHAQLLKVILQEPGLGSFCAHSTRGAAVSAVFAQGM